MMIGKIQTAAGHFLEKWHGRFVPQRSVEDIIGAGAFEDKYQHVPTPAVRRQPGRESGRVRRLVGRHKSRVHETDRTHLSFTRPIVRTVVDIMHVEKTVQCILHRVVKKIDDGILGDFRG